MGKVSFSDIEFAFMFVNSNIAFHIFNTNSNYRLKQLFFTLS